MDKPHLCFVGPMLGKNTGWVLSQGEILADMFAGEGYEVKLTSTVSNRFLRTVDIIKSLIVWRNQIDIVVLMVFSGPAFMIVEISSFLAKQLNKPIILWLHGGNLPNFSGRHFKRIKKALARADAIIAPSRYLADYFRQKSFPVDVIPNILVLQHYSYRQRKIIKPSILWMRAFHEIYQPRLALEVFEKIQKKYPQATLTMAGQDRGLLSSIKRLAKRENLRNKIRFTGFLNMKQKQKEFAKHDIFLNTSQIDNMPVSLLEAAAFGLPVITTGVGGIPRLFQNNKTALLIADNDICGMAEAVGRLLREPELAAFISMNGRKLAEKCSWLEVMPQWEALFDKIKI